MKHSPCDPRAGTRAPLKRSFWRLPAAAILILVPVAWLAVPALADCTWFLDTTYDLEVLACRPGRETAHAKAEAVVERHGTGLGGEDYVEQAAKHAGLIVTARTLALVYRPEPPGIELRYRPELEVGAEFELTLLESDYPSGCLELEPRTKLRLYDKHVCCDTRPAYGVCLVGLPVFRPSGVLGDSP